ncbi:MAG TPA: hypothetical protein VM266_15340 [Solirubrobacteraceae bacterium]|nr:hypothetical protein [Solirubrobacteraceae bacterium]
MITIVSIALSFAAIGAMSKLISKYGADSRPGFGGYERHSLS